MSYRHQTVHTRIWHDEKFRGLSDDARLLFFYVLTCPHSNLIGLFVLPKPYIAADIGWVPKRLEKPFRELLQKGFIAYDERTSIIWIRNHLRYNPLENPNQVKAAVKLVESLPKTCLFQGLAGLLEQFGKPFLEPLIKRLRERLGEGLGKPETETESETETENIYTIAPNDTGIVSEPSPDSPPPKSKGPPKIDFNWENGTFLGITEEDQQRWAEAYPAVDVELEVRRAAEWLLANPHRRKKNYRRFLTSWLSRQQERGGSRRATASEAHSGNPDNGYRKEWERLSEEERKQWFERARKMVNPGVRVSLEHLAFLAFKREMEAREGQILTEVGTNEGEGP